MRSPEFEELLRAPKRVLLSVWAVLTASVLIYVVIAYVVPISGRPQSKRSLELLAALTAAVIAGCSLFLRKRLISDQHIKRILNSEIDVERLSTNTRTKKIHSERLRLLSSLSKEERRLAALAFRLSSRMIVPFVLCESIALIGLVHALLFGNPSVIIAYAIGAIGLSLSMRPNLEAVMERAEKLAYQA